MTLFRWIALGVFGVLLIGFVFYLVKSNTPVSELAELATTGGDTQLRENLRPVQTGKRVLIFAFDGVGVDTLQQTIRSGKARRIQNLLGDVSRDDGVYTHGYAAPDTLSILPSTTMAAWSSVYTGEPPARTGVPGNEWFVREEMRFYAPAPVSVTENKHTLQMLNDGLVGNSLRTPTLYELVDRRAHVSLAPIYRGADIYTTPQPTALAELFAGVAKGVIGEQSVKQEVYSEIDEESVEKLIKTIDRHGVPTIQVVYFPGIDLYSHFADDSLNKQAQYLQEVLDPAIGRVLDTYERAGALNETYVLFIADHGHTPVLDDDAHALSTTGENEPPALIEKTGFRMRPFVLEPKEDEQDYQATVAYQGAMAYLYLADRSTCPSKGMRCDWRRPPRLEEDVLPIARAFYEANQTGASVPGLKGTLDLIFAREGRATHEEALPFKIFDGAKLVEIAEYLKSHPRPDLLQLEERMKGLAAGPYGHRAGDVLLLAKSGIERPIEERFYFSSFYRSWHGSPTAQDSRIPFIVARRGDSGERLRQIFNQSVRHQPPSQLDIVPLIRSLLE
ncbi:MAG: alkaline phosphatase family protein [Pyrinomonadaceae bacterium]|nr:alkaline phosphatase family protein [Pyrinomonadaceae bacterium]